ncbi:MAG: thioesterase [Spirochaetales bacterium]|nr:thioesterase [Spirochaetales bacterium]
MIHVKPYEMPIRINSYQTDTRSRLSLHSLFQIFQEAAYRHAEVMGCGCDVLRSRRQFWALSRVVVEIERMPSWNEELTLRTAAWKGEGLMVPRDIMLVDGEGKVCVRSTSYWIIMDEKERKPLLPETFFEGVQIDDACHLCGLPFRKVRGEFEEEPLYSRSVYYSSLDMNGHVNNASYLRFLFDGFDREAHETKGLSYFQITFQREAYLGDSLDIFRGRDKKGELLLKASDGGNDVVTARLCYGAE